MGVSVSSSHVVCAAPSFSGGGLLTLCPCLSMGSLPQETVLHELLQRESFPQHAVLHERLQRGSLARGAVLQEQAAPAWVPHRGTSPAPVWAPISTGPQVLPGACSSAGSPQGHSLLQASPCSGMGSSLGCRWRSAPPWASMDCRVKPASPWSSSQAAGESLLQHLEHLLSSASALTLVSAELLLSHILTPLSHCRFFARLKYLSQRRYHLH